MTPLEEHTQKRAALINADRALRVDHARLPHSMELCADKITRRIRTEEATTVWGVEHENVPHPFPGMEFLTGKAIISSTRLFGIIRKMPKGALLHAHLDLTVDPYTLLHFALRYPSFHIRSSEVITSSNISSIVPEIRPLAPDFPAEASSLTDPSYPPMSWVPFSRARERFDEAFGGPEGFDRWVTGYMSINPSAAYVTHNNNIRIWDKFRSAALLNMNIVYYTPLWRQYIRQFLEDIAADGILYVEVRINFTRRFMVGADGKMDVPHIEWLKIFKQVVDNFKQEREDFFDAKVIYTVIRDCDAAGLEEHLEDCLHMKKEFPDTIIGFDLVGDENILVPLKDYLEPLLQFKERQKHEGVSIPYIFHAGETCGDGTKGDENLYDAILLGTKRIGHGFSLVKHPKLMQICREQGIALEVCPISNEILRLTASMPMHPLPILLNHGVPVALSSDDPAIFQNMGLSYDFYQVVVASEVTGLLTLAHLARDSITYSMLEGAEKVKLMQMWKDRWFKFLLELVSSEKGQN
ncbi:Metallo-dependent hydrolase [Pisolithus orientalis]|uniref:Metallo-dependent hydrolase n=1 Tax=Pisolithus orientalis TaxID=936130 RepID=UPI0022245109|nr:Metallo-dependent hydrolase [Pisolithus orientalis]KAI6028501.1 Metallo-dependent hydrolase [Pisolithus orientalis]